MPTNDSASAVAERTDYRTPAVEVFEDEQAVWISADLPGVAPGNVEVAIDDGVVSLIGRITPPKANGETPKVVHAYQRRFTLTDPNRFDTDHVTAVMRDGVLELRLPKTERAKRRQIPVTVH